MTKLYVYETFQKVIEDARQIMVDSATSDEEVNNYLGMINKLWFYWPLNISKTKEIVAAKTIEREKYTLSANIIKCERM